MIERRATDRHCFGVEQRVAPLVEGRVPALEDFEQVRCIDFSRDGIGFYYHCRPDFQELVVALGLSPNITYMAARIMHVEMIELCGNLIFRVGCKFTQLAELAQGCQELPPGGELCDARSFLPDQLEGRS